MKALLLAAGFGKRLRPLTETIPKCLVPIRGKPLLGYWFDLLFSNGITEVVVNTHYLSESVERFVAGSPWQDRVIVVHENILLGTGGTILANRSHFSEEAFLVAHADNLTCFDVGEFMLSHRSRPDGTEMTMMTFDADNPQQCGIITKTKIGIVDGFYEKIQNPPGKLANAAVYILEPSIFYFLKSLNRDFIDFSNDVIPEFVGKIFCFHNSRYHRDIGTIESLQRAEQDFAILSGASSSIA